MVKWERVHSKVNSNEASSAREARPAKHRSGAGSSTEGWLRSDGGIWRLWALERAVQRHGDIKSVDKALSLC